MITSLFGLPASDSADLPLQQAFTEWLAAYNANDAAALESFYSAYQGDADIAFVRDAVRERVVARNHALSSARRGRPGDLVAVFEILYR